MFTIIHAEVLIMVSQGQPSLLGLCEIKQRNWFLKNICTTYPNSHKKNEGRICNEYLIIVYPEVITSYEMNIITPF